MRIIAGAARGKSIKTPKGMTTRPTLEKVREAIFSTLAPYLEQAVVLDAFAGSGALGLEALSRGAERVIFCEKARPVQQIIRENTVLCGFAGRAGLYRGAAEEFLRRFAGELNNNKNNENNNENNGINSDAKAVGTIFGSQITIPQGFDIVLLDPPYDKGHIATIEPLLLLPGVLKPGAVVMLETASREPELFSAAVWQLYKTKTYGDTAVYYYGL